MEITIRNACIQDFDAVTRIMNQVQQLHVDWRPDIYKPNNQLIPKEVFEEIVKGDTFFVAETGEKVVGVMEIMYRHIENPAQITRDVIYIDTMAVEENYRGQGNLRMEV